MQLLSSEQAKYDAFVQKIEGIISVITPFAGQADIKALEKLIQNFKNKTADFFCADRKLNIGVVGQVKAGKSSFLNTLLFQGQEILPKASTPKTATLTKMEYAEKNAIVIEYYTPDEWEQLERNSHIDSDEEEFTSAREIMTMVRKNGIHPLDYLSHGTEEIPFSSYEDLMLSLNQYVGEDGKYTPLVKSVTLYLHKDEFLGLSIVDTPGLNDPIVSRTVRTKEFIEHCDVVFFLSQAGSFLDNSDWNLLSTQLPQKGVKRLVLIASKFDSGIRDVLRVKDETYELFGPNPNAAYNIPDAYQMIERKLQRRAKDKVRIFVADLENRGAEPELIQVIKTCAEPFMISAMVHNMINKPVESYSPEEQNTYAALSRYSEHMESDLELLGSFERVHALFQTVAAEKEIILLQKSGTFIPNATAELMNDLRLFAEKTEKRIQILKGNDREQLLEQKNAIEKQIHGIQADIASVFGDLLMKLEREKGEGIRSIRSASTDYATITTKTGTKTVTNSYTVSDSKWYKPWTWGRSHVETSSHERKYSYYLASDAVENLRKYANESMNQIEKVFSDAVNQKELKRKLADVILHNFDTTSEHFDSAMFRLVVEETISSIEFPVFTMDISNSINAITSKFSGEITDSSQKTQLSVLLASTLSGLYDALCKNLETKAKEFKTDVSSISAKIERSLLENITIELDSLIQQCSDKDKEIASLTSYLQLLRQQIL